MANLLCFEASLSRINIFLGSNKSNVLHRFNDNEKILPLMKAIVSCSPVAILDFTVFVQSTDQLRNRSSRRRCSVRKGVLKNFAIFTEKDLWQSLLAQAFSCEFYEFSKNTVFTEHVWATEGKPIDIPHA